jgi:hypothetical protein
MRRELHVRFWEGAGVRFPRATRLVRSVKEECLDRMIPLGERHFRRAVTEFVDHYHWERNHQGLENALIVGTPAIDSAGRVHRRSRLGGSTSARRSQPIRPNTGTIRA